MKVVSIREPYPADEDSRLSSRALEMHRFLFRASLSAANLFAWIFVFQYFYVMSGDIAHAFARVALLYALCQLVVTLATPLSVGFLRYGARRGLVEAALLAAAAFVVLGATLEGFWGGAYSAYGMLAFAIILGFYRAFYWMPYEAEAHRSTSGGGVWKEVAIALVPLCAGLFLVSDPMAPVWLLFFAAALIALSVFPLHGVRDVHERLPLSYRETFAEFAAPEHRDLVRRSIFEGAYGAALLFLWPIGVFLIVGWSYGMLGIILSITFLVGILGRGIVRKTIRRLDLHDSRVFNILLVVSPWILRLSVATPLGVILVDSYFYTTTPKRLGMDPVIFDQAGDAGYFLDEYTAIKEMGLALGRIAMCALAATLALFFSLPIALIGAFALAALLSIWSAR